MGTVAVPGVIPGNGEAVCDQGEADVDAARLDIAQDAAVGRAPAEAASTVLVVAGDQIIRDRSENPSDVV